MTKREKFKRGWRRMIGVIKKIFGIIQDVDEYVDKKL